MNEAELKRIEYRTAYLSSVDVRSRLLGNIQNLIQQQTKSPSQLNSLDWHSLGQLERQINLLQKLESILMENKNENS